MQKLSAGGKRFYTAYSGLERNPRAIFSVFGRFEKKLFFLQETLYNFIVIKYNIDTLLN